MPRMRIAAGIAARPEAKDLLWMQKGNAVAARRRAKTTYQHIERGSQEMKVTKLKESARIPEQATPGSAGYDLCAVTGSTIYPGQRLMINHGDAPWKFNSGERVAQFVVIPCYHGACVEVGSLEETMRGDGGYGSTGA